MLTRRKLFGLLAAAPLVSLGGAAILPPPKLKDAPDGFSYRGYEIMWTGWKQEWCSINEAAQWVAFDIKAEKYFYASSGGEFKRFRRGEIFDISRCQHGCWVDKIVDDKAKGEIRKRTLDNLIALLHKEGF